jgi:diguanylate cyclase (GGDEF)-like protein
VSLDGVVEADTLGGRLSRRPFPVAGLLDQARNGGEASALVSFEGRPFQLVMVPVLAPRPIAWVCLGFAVDDGVLDEVHRQTALEVSVWGSGRGDALALLSTLPPPQKASLLERIRAGGGVVPEDEPLRLGGEAYETRARRLPTADSSQVEVLLQRSITDAERPLRRLELQIFGLSTLALVAAALAAALFARGITRPLVRLADGALRIERGDYATPVAPGGADEIGRLATAFNRMQGVIGEREERIRHQATHDELTGLPNRTLFLDRLASAISAARRRGELVGMLVLDVDRFKEVNDTLGHGFGDSLLAEVGRRLTASLRESDTVARLGGDEFAVMFHTTGEQGALDVARRVAEALEGSFALGGVSIDVRASSGIAIFPWHAEDAGSLLKRADVAMYDAKRNQLATAVYEPGRDGHSLRRLAILSELRHAVEEGQLELHYQPVLDLRGAGVSHAEALVRWRHPRHGMMPPDEFIALAEQSGSISVITRWVLARAIADCAAWTRAGHELGVAVNLSALDVRDDDLPAVVDATLREADLPPLRLGLEITESAVMKDVARARRMLARLAGQGVRLAIDDYGTGYSSLAQLKRLPVQELKIDRSFLAHLDEDGEDLVIVRSTIELGHNMGLGVVAEGVETAASLATLTQLGCDFAQGYHVSRPLAPADLLSWLSARAGSPPPVPTPSSAG